MTDHVTHQCMMKTLAGLQHQMRALRVQRVLGDYARSNNLKSPLQIRFETEIEKKLQNTFVIDELLDEYDAYILTDKGTT